MTGILEARLRRWGRWTLKYIHWADEYGENILYRANIIGSRNRPGHKVLSPDVPPEVRRTDKAINGLSDIEREALLLWYCFPHNPDTGKYYTKQDFGDAIGVTGECFKKRLSRARKNVRKKLEL